MKKRTKLYNKIYSILVGIIIFLVPTNFFLKFFEGGAYVNSLRVDYLIPKLYLSDILILAILFIWLLNSRKKFHSCLQNTVKFLQKKYWLVTLFALIFIRQLLTAYPISSVVYLLRIIELGLFANFLIENKKKIESDLIEKFVLATLLFQSSVAVFQFMAQKSIFGYFLLGEPNLNNYIGISKTALFGVEKILPYGTSAHPNVLGGVLALYLIYILSRVEWKFKKMKWRFKLELFLNNIIISMAIIALFLTQSVSAIVTFVLGLSFIIFQKYSKKNKKILQKRLTLKNIAFLTLGLIFISVISLSLLAKKYPENQSINRRNYLNSAAIDMARNNIFVGVGLNNFTSEVENFSNNREIVRFVQPTHNVFLLFIAEAGLLGIIFLVLLINMSSHKKHSKIFQLQKIFKNKNKNWWWIVVLLPIALLDHYLLSLNAGMLLLVFSTVFLSESN